MSQQADSPKTFVSGEALSAFRRVKISGSTVVYADAGEHGIGVTQEAVASGDNVSVRLDTHGGSQKVTASKAIIAATVVYGAADGKVTDSASGNAVGQTCEAATAANDIIEIVPIPAA